MNRPPKTAVLVLAVALCAGAGGCAVVDWIRSLGRGPNGREMEAMSLPEAHSVLARARQCLYGRRTPDTARAVRLADAVATRCSEPPCSWEAYAVKAAAHQAAGDHEQAALAARHGVDTVLSARPGRLDDTALTALKRLSVVYVENAVAARGSEKPADRLAAWEQKLRGHYRAGAAEDHTALQAVEAMFRVLQELTEEAVAERRPERRARRLIRRYIRLFNERDVAALWKLVRPGSPAAGFLRGLPGSPRSTLEPLGNIHVSVSDETRAATVTCDFLATSPAGWARVFRGVRFKLLEQEDDTWQIQGITGHP